MNQVIKGNLMDQEGNYTMPFLWLRGEEERLLREMMGVIYNCGIRSVCVESRPHPDFVGPKWWQDMDVILDEARKRDMKVWILDDSHFPTGYTNGALKNYDASYRRQSMVCETVVVCGDGKQEISIQTDQYLWPVFKKSWIEERVMLNPEAEIKFDDNRFLSITAYGKDGQVLNLIEYIKDGVLTWQAPEGEWKICFCVLTRNIGPHRDYINMMDEKSCRVLIDTVYESHYGHYKDDFGKTIAGFFSDEPELGNGHLYDFDDVLGKDMDVPWSAELETELKTRLGDAYGELMPLLWNSVSSTLPEEIPDGRKRSNLIAEVRYAYMDAVTRLVEKNFSFQIGDWCREHGVEYIGHLIEDNNHHARMGSSLGHYFRGIGGMDMAGIDDIGGQVLPQGEDVEIKGALGNQRDGEFFHYALGKLGTSFAAIDPLKKGRTMCEIFGAYGWGEGVYLEKYLADHFMVRGVNRFVPHAFSAKEYPDPDCPPHFYARGNNPQYRHFGKLVRYMNRICGLIDGGRHIAPAAVLYHGEGEWTGKYMLMQKPARILTDQQIEFDYIPSDVFAETERYQTVLDGGLKVNDQEYKVLIVPEVQYVSKALVKSISKLREGGFPVFFINSLPEGIYDGAAEENDELLKDLEQCHVASLEQLTDALETLQVREIKIEPTSDRVRYYHYAQENDIYYFVNESKETYEGKITVPTKGCCYLYNAWENRIEKADVRELIDGTEIAVILEPSKSVIVIFDSAEAEVEPLVTRVRQLSDMKILNIGWKRSICRSIDYPHFVEPEEVSFPDHLAEDKPEFSGYVRYENTFIGKKGETTVLEITDAAEGVEVFVNGSSLGIQVVPTYRYDITEALEDGENTIAIEVATTLERENFNRNAFNFGQTTEPTAQSGITGSVLLYR